MQFREKSGQLYPVALYDENMHFRGEAKFDTKFEAGAYMERYKEIVKQKKKVKLTVKRL